MMFKKLTSALVLAMLFQGYACAATFLGTEEKTVVENKLSVVSSEIGRRKTANIDDYASPEIFANFREIQTTGIRPKTLYRSSNPMDTFANKARHKYADMLAEKAGIAAEIDLADNDQELERNFPKKGFKEKYCYNLYQQGKLLNVKLRGNGLDSRDWDKLATAFRFMLDNDGPYLIHCRLGQDRAGFFSMLCAALAGATVDDLRKDYMLTYCNYYHLEPKSYEYEQIRKYRCDKILYYIAHPEFSRDKTAIPDDISVNGIVPEESAVAFLKTALKLSDAEILALQKKLKKNGEYDYE